jgi:hypothetical protein
MQYTEQLSQGLAFIAKIAPASYSAKTSSDGIDMRLFNRVIFVINNGVIGANTVAGVVTGSTDNSTFATTITGKSLSAGTFSGTIDNNCQAIIEVTSEECQTAGVRYIRLDLTPSGAGLLSAIALAGVTRYSPASKYDLTSVNEIVA